MVALEPNTFNMAAIGAGLAVGLAGIGTGMSQGPIGAATVGAVAEDRSFFGLGIVFVALPETIVIFGLVFAILLMFL
jgi:V/A-type H+-transporting ATPase subunit K